MSYRLRPYQEEIVEKAFKDLAVSGEKPILHSICMGAGKTWVIAELAKRWREKGLGKVLVLTLSKELCLQDYDKLCLVAGEESVGIYSASWKRKETADITVATAQSAYKHPELWKEYSLVVADECLDGDCEVLTPTGWVKFKNYDGKTPIAQFSPENERISFVVPLRFITHKNREVVRFSAQDWSFDATLGHRHLVKKSHWRQKTLESSPSRQLIERIREIETLTLTTSELELSHKKGDTLWFFDRGFVRDTPCTPIERLGIAIEADGTLYRTNSDGTKIWKIEVSKQRKIERLESLLNECGISYRENVIKRPGWEGKGWKNPTNFVFTMPNTETDYKTFASFLSFENIPTDFVDEILFWDGSTSDVSHWDTTRKTEALFVETAAHLCGRNMHLSCYGRKNAKHKPLYRLVDCVHGNDRGVFPAKSLSGLKKSERLYRADVYCVTVPTSYFLVRKNGHIWVTGNCDSLNPDGIAGGLYLHKHVYGLTGTAYATVGSRKGKWFTTKLWPLHKIKSKRFGWFWQPISYELSAKQMLKMGYHTPLKIYSKPINCHLLKLQSNGSEYTADSLETWAKATLRRVVEVMQKAEETGMCHCGIVFMPSVESCEMLEEECAKRNISAHAVHAKTPDKERLETINNHKEGKLKWLINMGVATRGFDNPQVDCLLIARATASLRLWNQILGRGVRLAEGKTVCNVLDLTKNSQNMGNITDVEMGKALKNGYACDTILLKGKDISGMEVSKINLQEKKQHANATGARQSRKKGTKSPHRGRNSSEH